MKGRIGLAAVLVAALLGLSASPASAAGSKKTAGTITNGNSVVLLNTSGFAKVTLTCHNTFVTLDVDALGDSPLDIWIETSGGAITYGHDTSFSRDAGKPNHIDWSVSRGTKITFGQVFDAGTNGGDDCIYTSQIS